MKMLKSIPLFRSPRFWGVVVGSLGVSIQTHGLTDPDLVWTAEVVVNSILFWLELVIAGAVTIRTADRHGEKKKK